MQMNKEWNGQSLIELRRELHRSAEVGFSLDGTRSIIQNALSALDVLIILNGLTTMLVNTKVYY